MQLFTHVCNYSQKCDQHWASTSKSSANEMYGASITKLIKSTIIITANNDSMPSISATKNNISKRSQAETI